jgi:predicted DNA-binding transcriptional regulator YafY
MGVDQLTRCLKIINLLQTRIGRKTEDIAFEVGVSKRTVYRDFRLLEDAGIPIRYDSEVGGHLIDTYSHLKVTNLLDDELVALLFSAQISAKTLNQQFYSTVNQAISKMLLQLPHHFREEMENLLTASAVDEVDLLNNNEQQEIYNTIIKGIRKKQRIRIVSQMLECPTPIQTSLAPYKLVASTKGWYVIGHSSLHRKVVRFQLESIHNAELTTDLYKLPHSFRPHTLSLKAFSFAS